jgi:hypothetical protein
MHHLFHLTLHCFIFVNLLVSRIVLLHGLALFLNRQDAKIAKLTKSSASFAPKPRVLSPRPFIITGGLHIGKRGSRLSAGRAQRPPHRPSPED